jgi:hypothetical protein
MTTIREPIDIIVSHGRSPIEAAQLQLPCILTAVGHDILRNFLET